MCLPMRRQMFTAAFVLVVSVIILKDSLRRDKMTSPSILSSPIIKRVTRIRCCTIVHSRYLRGIIVYYMVVEVLRFWNSWMEIFKTVPASFGIYRYYTYCFIVLLSSFMFPDRMNGNCRDTFYGSLYNIYYTS